MRRLVFVLPVLVVAVLGVYFAAGLGRDPQKLPSALIDKPVPEFALPPIAGQKGILGEGFASTDLKGQVTLVNIFGSWCVSCRFEHPFLMELKAGAVIPIFGIDWREQNRADGPAWLAKYGNPYTRIGDDPKSVGAIAFGVTGAPESFIVDRHGVVRYKHTGVITKRDWERTLWPIVQDLRKQ
jgi:cytochrome c biogenesis protein CcmG/thiol:disulfide interchange protein DsbE